MCQTNCGQTNVPPAYFNRDSHLLAAKRQKKIERDFLEYLYFVVDTGDDKVGEWRFCTEHMDREWHMCRRYTRWENLIIQSDEPSPQEDRKLRSPSLDRR